MCKSNVNFFSIIVCLLTIFLAITSFNSTVYGYDYLLEKGELSLSIKPLVGFGNPEESTSETPYFYGSIFKLRYAILKNFEVYGALEGYNPGASSAESYQKMGVNFYLSRKGNFGIKFNAETLLFSSSLTPYTVAGELFIKLLHK